MSGRITWLASYPRSGNTWVRAFLSAWRSGAEAVDLDALEGLGTAGSRPMLDPLLGLPTSQLPEPEVQALRPALYRELSRRAGPCLVKVHDAFERLPSGEPLFPAEATGAAVYLVRNPLDVAPSLQRFLGLPGLREAVDFLGSPRADLAGKADRAVPQVRQHMGTWSEHVGSWTGQGGFPVCVLRYEDLVERPEEGFARLLEALGEEPEPGRLRRALRACRLEALSSAERERGFRENPGPAPFFGPGRVGLGRALLGPDLVDEVVAAHGEVMARFGYLSPAEESVREARRFHAQGAPGLAFVQAAEALRRDPGHRPARGLFVHHARHHRLAGRSDLRPALEACLGDPELPVEGLAPACAEVLLRRAGEPLEALAADPLLLSFLARTVNQDPRMELFLRDLRRRVLERHPLPSPLWPLASGLALQGLRSGYVASASPEELERVPVGEDEASLLAWALYRPLAGHPAVEALEARPDEAWSEALLPLLQEGLRQPRREAELGRSTPSLGEVEDPVSLAVRRQYEESPYPRWIELPRVRARVSLGEVLEERFPGRSFPARFREPVRILVPGCGTGKHPLSAALRYRWSALVALDLSRASLGMARRRAEEAGIEGIRFVHGDLLELGRLEEGPFDLISCVGVLHHMEDPARGLAALLEVLAPGGVLDLGLYSERGRSLIARAREEIARRGLGADPAGIRAFRDEALDPASPWHPLTGTSDFYAVATCRDLLFHVQEHRFTPLGLAALLEGAGLEFLGFRHRRDEVPRVYRAWNPADPAGTDLSAWDRFEREKGSSTGLYQFMGRRRGE